MDSEEGQRMFDEYLYYLQESWRCLKMLSLMKKYTKRDLGFDIEFVLSKLKDEIEKVKNND